MKQGKSFSEIEVGDSDQFEVLVDEKAHSDFSKLFGDFSPIHTDPEFSSKSGFKKRIGYAFFLTGLLSRFYGEHLPGGSSVCIKQEAKFVKPFYPGDSLRVRGEVVRKVNSTKFVEIKTEIFRDDGEKVFEGLGFVQIIV